MTVARTTNALLSAAAIMLMGAVGMRVYLDVSIDRSPPVEFHRAWFLEPFAEPGQAVTLAVDRTRTKACPGQAYEMWLHEGGNIVAQGRVVPSGHDLSLGRYTTRFRKQVPAVIRTEGRWCYAPTVRYSCADGEHVLRQPEACLDVRIR